ncbi:hypothetical protein TNCV_1641471 [Trichonephila clavipes]|nr:hypothetical protein TNCV_1641471 [Trichonephila clavipes]
MIQNVRWVTLHEILSELGLSYDSAQHAISDVARYFKTVLRNHPPRPDFYQDGLSKTFSLAIPKGNLEKEKQNGTVIEAEIRLFAFVLSGPCIKDTSGALASDPLIFCDHDVQELWFQQDGATCHTARATVDLLKDTFGDRLISRFGPVNWPPRSCDLTPLDYFLWGYVKSLVYADKPQTLDHLEDNIRRVNADIRSQMLEKVIENWTSRLDYIRASRGSSMPEIIFKI